MMNFTELPTAPSNALMPFTDQLRLAMAAYLARFKDSSRYHTESDLRCYLAWCAECGLDPLQASTGLASSTGSLSTHPPSTSAAQPCRLNHRRRGSRTCSSKLCSRQRGNRRIHPTSRWWHCWGLLGLRIFEATGADIADLGKEHGHRVPRVCGTAAKVVLIPLPPAVGRAIDRAIGTRANGPILLNNRGARMDRHAATRSLQRLAEAAGMRITSPHPHMLRQTFVTTMLDAGPDLRNVQIAAPHADPHTTMRYDRPRKNLHRHLNYILAAYMASGA